MKAATPEAVAAKLRRLSPLCPELAIVLGSGFDSFLEEVECDAQIPYARLPGFPALTTGGHRGELAVGRLSGQPVVVLAGRAHLYEGHSPPTVTFPIRALAAYGVRDLLLTNAAGGINARLRVGDFMVLKDHINFMGQNPLCGPAVPRLTRFVDLSCTYDASLRRLLQRAGRECGLVLKSGVYLAVTGPSYETPAEIRAFGRLGADAVGMSTVPEAIVARQCGLRVAAVSCITNLASGLSPTPLSHREVLENASNAQQVAGKLLRQFMALYAAEGS